MRLTRMNCDGCGRKPTLGEWFKGEITMAGYPEWRHPGIAFKEAGVPMVLEKRAVWSRGWQRLFGGAVPDELAYLCPECQTKVDLELPDLLPELEREAEEDRLKQEALGGQQRQQERSYFGGGSEG